MANYQQESQEKKNVWLRAHSKSKMSMQCLVYLGIKT